jgi:anti-sigma factor RsiW
MAEPDNCGTDTAAYVLGALEPGEEAAFRAHLATCATCQAEVADLEAAAQMLPHSVPQETPSPELKRRLMAEIEADPRARPASSRARPPADRAGARPFTFGRFVPAAGFAAALVLAVLVGTQLGGSGGTSASRVIEASVGRAAVRVTGSRGELIVRQLPPAPPNSIYEVWVERGRGAPIPTDALFGVTHAGRASVDIPGGVKGVSAVLVTAEPAGGTRVPTTKPVIVASLS